MMETQKIRICDLTNVTNLQSTYYFIKRKAGNCTTKTFEKRTPHPSKEKPISAAIFKNGGWYWAFRCTDSPRWG